MESPLFCEGNIQIYGKCEKEYEPVKDAFIQNFVSGQELNASICVYVKEKCVIDLYGTSNNDSSYNSESLQVIHFSESSWWIQIEIPTSNVYVNDCTLTFHFIF